MVQISLKTLYSGDGDSADLMGRELGESLTVQVVSELDEVCMRSKVKKAVTKVARAGHVNRHVEEVHLCLEASVQDIFQEELW